MKVVDMKQSQCKMLVKDLPEKAVKNISMHLNPKMVCGGDWKSLAGELGMKMLEILNYETVQDPTLAVLRAWWSGPGDTTVSRLIEIMDKMKRADVVRILEPFEYVGMFLVVLMFAILNNVRLWLGSK